MKRGVSSQRGSDMDEGGFGPKRTASDNRGAFAPRAEASSYQPTWRDYVTMALKQAYGADQRRLSPEEERLLSGFTGSSGIRGSVGSPTGAIDALTMFAAPQSSIPRALAVGGAPQWVDAGNALALEQPKKAAAHGVVGTVEGLINRLGGGPSPKRNVLSENSSFRPTGPWSVDAPRGADGMTVYRGGGRESGKLHKRFDPDAAPPESYAAKLRAAFASPDFDTALTFTSPTTAWNVNRSMVQQLKLEPGNYFDHKYKPHMDAFKAYMKENPRKGGEGAQESMYRQIQSGLWRAAERKYFQDYLKKQGFDGWWAREGGDTIGVFEKGKLKNQDGSTFWSVGAAAPVAYGATRDQDKK